MVDAIESEGANHVEAVLSVALWRDWLVELTSLFGDADDAVRDLAAPDGSGVTSPTYRDGY